MRITKTYSELSTFETFEERFDYLALAAGVGEETFGHDRWLNQRFYRSREWARIRNHVIARDLGYDLGVEGFDIIGKLYVHHMNPMTAYDIRHATDGILEPEGLITVSHETHNALHYGGRPPRQPVLYVRGPGDTKLW